MCLLFSVCQLCDFTPSDYSRWFPQLRSWANGFLGEDDQIKVSVVSVSTDSGWSVLGDGTEQTRTWQVLVLHALVEPTTSSLNICLKLQELLMKGAVESPSSQSHLYCRLELQEKLSAESREWRASMERTSETLLTGL